MNKRQGPEGPLRNAILIAGPTASGKSALALGLARRTGGAVVNADSMQVYGVLRVLTARPDVEDLAAAPHLLYGHVDPGAPYSTGTWMREVEQLVRSGAFADRPAIFTGGTGLYFRALTEGLSQMPPVPDAIRAGWRDELEKKGASTLHRLLAERDPETAATIEPGDGQRIVRALEVLEASGRPISHWRKTAGTKLVDTGSARLFVIEPDRTALSERIARRFDTMIARGALEEARVLAARGIDPAMPAMKAIGVRELIMADSGAISMDEAIERAKIATRQYAKRQSTWFRNQLGLQWRRIRMPDRAGADWLPDETSLRDAEI